MRILFLLDQFRKCIFLNAGVMLVLYHKFSIILHNLRALLIFAKGNPHGRRSDYVFANAPAISTTQSFLNYHCSIIPSTYMLGYPYTFCSIPELFPTHFSIGYLTIWCWCGGCFWLLEHLITLLTEQDFHSRGQDPCVKQGEVALPVHKETPVSDRPYTICTIFLFLLLLRYNVAQQFTLHIEINVTFDVFVNLPLLFSFTHRLTELPWLFSSADNLHGGHGLKALGLSIVNMIYQLVKGNQSSLLPICNIKTSLSRTVIRLTPFFKRRPIFCKYTTSEFFIALISIRIPVHSPLFPFHLLP